MDTKISSEFWSHPEIEPAPFGVKLTALWLLTNERMKMCGYAEVTEKRFAFETGLSSEDFARAFQALPETFMRVGKGYFAPSYIRWQFGDGPKLAKSFMSVPLVNALVTCPMDVVSKVLELYPELTGRYEEAAQKAHGKGIPSPTHGQRVGEGVREGVREGAEKEQSVEKPRRARAPKPGSIVPSNQPEPIRRRMLAVNALKNRSDSTRWAAEEMAAFREAGLDVLSDVDFAAQLEPLQKFYGANIAKDQDFRRRELIRVLRHWAGELDKARLWLRENDDGLKRL